MYYCVLQSTTPVLLRTTKYYSSTTPYFKCTSPVLLRTAPVLLRTTKYYAVLFRTTKYQSSTTLYYKVLLEYYSVLQSTTPVLLSTTRMFQVPCVCRVRTWGVIFPLHLLLYQNTLKTTYIHATHSPYFTMISTLKKILSNHFHQMSSLYENSECFVDFSRC